MPSLATSRLTIYGAFSTVLVSAVIASAFHKHSNFYSATVFLSRSSASVMVLANYGVLLTLLFGRFVQRLFFGRLTNQEVERLYDRTWFFLTESLLAFTIFRDEFDAPFVVMFGILLFLKCFHWLIADRMDWMDQQPYPGPPMLFHLRTNVMFLILWTIDMLMLEFAIESVIAHGVGGIVLFGSEYAILLASCLNSILKYFVMVYDLRRARTRGGEDAPVWENKGMYMFYIELITDFLKLGTYLTFFMIVMTFFGLPLNIIRDVYMTGVSFYTRFRDLMRYRAATKDMENKYPNATPAELETMSDRTCIICREEMIVQSRLHANPPEVALGPNGLPQPGQTLGLNDPPKKLPCGHIFHFQCLRSWLERQQSCPTCRRSVLEGLNMGNVNAGNGNQNPNQQNANAFLPQDVPVPPAPNPGARNMPVQGQNNALPAQPGAVQGAVNARQQFAGNILNALGVGGAANDNEGMGQSGGNRVRAQQIPPRAFQGFSVGGAWHPWGISGLDGEMANLAGPSGISGLSSSASSSTPLARATSSRSISTGAIQGVASPSGSSNGTITPTVTFAPASSESEQQEDARADPLPPREAAAAAALGRLAASSSKSARPSEAASRVTEGAAPRSDSLLGTAASTSSPSEPSASQPTPASSSASSSTQSSAAPKQVTVPTLIPLFDPSSVAHRPFFNLSDISTMTPGMMSPSTPAYFSNPLPPSSSSASASTSQYPPSFPWTLNHMGPFSVSSTPATQTPARTPARVHSSASLSGMFSAAMNNASFSDVPLPEGAFSPLPRTDPDTTPFISLPTPSTFADEGALRKLDTLTREAIDERLRVLEDVQRKLWSAAEELKKVKGALPPPAPPTMVTSLPTSLSVEGYVSAPESGYTSVVGRKVELEKTNELVSGVEERLGGVMDPKGKGKARAVDEVPIVSQSQSQPQSQLRSESGGSSDDASQGQSRTGEGEDLSFSTDALLVEPESGDVAQ